MYRHSNLCVLPHRDLAQTCRRHRLVGRLALLTVLMAAAAAPAAVDAEQVRTPTASQPTSGRTTIPIPAQNPVGIAAMSGRMWVTDAGTGEVLELNPSTGKLIRKFKLGLKQPKGLAFDGQRLWVADEAARKIVAYNLANGRQVKAIPVLWPEEKEIKGIEALGWDGKTLWMVLVGDASSMFNQVDAESGLIVRSMSADCDSRGIAFSASLLFNLCVNSDRDLAAVIQRQVTSQAAEMRKTQRVVQVLAAIAPAGLTYDGTKLWVLDAKRKQAITVRIDQAPKPQQQQAIVCDQTAFSDVSWKVCLFWAEDKGIWISSADILPKPPGVGVVWIRVLSESGPVEIFTPYHGDVPQAAHLLDMNQWACVDPLNTQDAGSNGLLLTIPTNYPTGPCPESGTPIPNIVREIRDRGISYLCKDGGSYVSRGEEVVYWSVFDAGNYDYIVEYAFRDDGTIAFRMGATGFNNGSRPFDAHTHSALWRIHPDIAGPGAASKVFVQKHEEPLPPMTGTAPLSLATDSSQQVTYESFFDFDPKAFTTLHVEATSSNNLFGPRGYELQPLVQGISRHDNLLPSWPLGREFFAQHDFFVTKFYLAELYPATIGSPSQGITVGPDDYLLPQLGLAQGTTPESLTNPDTDVVVWLRTSAHHMPRNEDRPNWPGHTSPNNGITLVHWMGFDFVPHDFFDYNPLGGPRFCGCGNGACEPNEDCCTCPADCGGVSCC